MAERDPCMRIHMRLCGWAPTHGVLFGLLAYSRSNPEAAPRLKYARPPSPSINRRPTHPAAHASSVRASVRLKVMVCLVVCAVGERRGRQPPHPAAPCPRPCDPYRSQTNPHPSIPKRVKGHRSTYVRGGGGGGGGLIQSFAAHRSRRRPSSTKLRSAYM